MTFLSELKDLEAKARTETSRLKRLNNGLALDDYLSCHAKEIAALNKEQSCS